MTLALRPLIALMLVAAASGSLAAPKKKPAAPAVEPAPAACADFYGHVNNGWLKANPLPIGIQSFSRWDELNASALRQTHELLANTNRSGAGPASDLLAVLSASTADPVRMDASAHAAAAPLLAQINAIRKPKDIVRVIATMHSAGVPVAYGFDVVREADTGQARATFYASGLGLPDPAYYTSTVPELQRAIVLYGAYLRQLLEFSGVSPASSTQQAASAFALEQSLAAAMGNPSTDTVAVAQLAKSYPNLQMAEFMQVQGAAPSVVSVDQPSYFRALDAMLAKPAIPQWQAYLRTQVAHSLSATMARDLRQPYLFALGVASPGTGDVPAGERLALLAQHEGMELLSAAYVEKFLDKGKEQRAEAIAEAIRAAMGRSIDRAEWLSPGGKTASRQKLVAMRLAIGRPADPVSLVGLAFDRNDYAGNVLALRRWNRARSLARLSSAVWPLPVSQAQPVIGYQPSENRLVATAAVLQAPAFEARSTPFDYGSFGALLAQQMSLGFADYTENDGRGLADRQSGLVAQYNAYPATPALPVNGQRMQRQNAADLAGVEIAWDAFNTSQVPSTPAANQEFFSAWAGLWARRDTAAALAEAQAQSAFAPAKWRANGPLSNLPAFAQAFSCKAGQAMTQPAAVQSAIWR